MLALEDLPPPSNTTTIALIGLALVFWLGMRVNILRRLLARHVGDEAAVEAPAWLRRLALWRGTYPLLGAVAAGLVALLFV